MLFLKEMESLETWDAEHFKMIMQEVQKQTNMKGKKLWMPVRVALTGQVHGPDLSKLIEILGVEKCRRFLKEAFLET